MAGLTVYVHLLQHQLHIISLYWLPDSGNVELYLRHVHWHSHLQSLLGVCVTGSECRRTAERLFSDHKRFKMINYFRNINM